MKRFFFSFVAISAIVVSCAKEELTPVTPEVNDGTYSFKALISDVTKTSINDEGAMAWITGDQISVYDGAFETFTLKGEASGAEATFTGELTNPSAVALAVCPDGIGSEVADEMLTLVLPESYEYDGQSTHAPMIASGFSVNDKTATIQFKHVGGLFKVTYNNVPEEAKTFCFEASKQIAGELYIEDYRASGAAIAVGESETDKTVTYTINLDDDHSSMSFYVPVPVGTFDFNISLKDVDGNKIAKSSKKKSSFTIARGDYVAIPAINMPQKFVENFTSTKVNSDNYDSSSSITTSGYTDDHDYTWTSSGSVYVFKHGIKLGKSGGNGTVTNTGDKKMLSDIATGTIFTIKVFGTKWNGDNGKLVVTYNGDEQPKEVVNGSLSNNSASYDESDFTQSTDFVFQKVEGVDVFSIASSEKRILIDKVVVEEGGVLPAAFGVSTEAINVAWDATEASFNVVADEKVLWTILADDGLALSQNSGSGNATINLTFDQNEEETQIQKTITVSTEYESVVDEKEYTITFTQAGKPAQPLDGDGSKETPYSISDALYLINNLADGAVSVDAYYIAGNICEIKSYYSGGKSINYYIGTEENNVYVYGGRDLGNGDFTSKEDLSVGDELIVYGKFQKYVKDSKVTPEIVNSYIYSYNGKTSILTGITLGEKKTEYFQNDAFVKPTVTASYKGKENAVVTDETTFSGYDMSVVGTQTVKASYTEGGVEKIAQYDITVADNSDYSITTNFDSSKGSVSVKVNNEEATTAKATQSVVVTVTPNSGNIVKSFKVNNAEQALTSGSYTFKMPAENVVIDVTFDAKPAEQTITQTSFSAVSGNLNGDANISYGATKGKGTTNPAINSNKIRLYKPSSGNTTGGILTITANNEAKITSVTVVSNRSNAFNIAVDGKSQTAIENTTTYTVSDINASEVTFTNKYSDSNDISSIKVTYYGGTVPEPEKLEMTTVSVDSKTSSSITFKWDAVEHAMGYKVKVGSGSYGDTQTGTTYTVSDLEPEQTVIVYVYAVGNGGLYLDSDPKSCEGTTSAGGQGGGTPHTYTMTIDSSNNGNNNVHWTGSSVTSLTYDNVIWTTSVTGTTSFTSSTTYCQVGSKNNPATKVSLQTSAFAGKTITSVKVTCYCMTNTGPTLTVTAGSLKMINAVALTKTTSTEMSSSAGITATLGASDILSIEFNSSAKAAICISKIEVSYTD